MERLNPIQWGFMFLFTIMAMAIIMLGSGNVR